MLECLHALKPDDPILHLAHPLNLRRAPPRDPVNLDDSGVDLLACLSELRPGEIEFRLDDVEVGGEALATIASGTPRLRVVPARVREEFLQLHSDL